MQSFSLDCSALCTGDKKLMSENLLHAPVKRGLMLFRNDLRLDDNEALRRFVGSVEQGVLLWCPNKSHLRAGVFRRSFLYQALAELKGKISEFGGRLLVAQQPIQETLPTLIASHKIERIYINRELTFDEQRDEQWLAHLGVEVDSSFAHTLIDPRDLCCPINDLPEVFTTFRRAVEKHWLIRPCVSAPCHLPTTLSVDDYTLCKLDDDLAAKQTHIHPHLKGGASVGEQRLRSYIWELDRLRTYKETRNGMLAWDDSSKLSAWLATGCLSARRVYEEVKRFEAEVESNESTYWLVFELLWRDYFHFMAGKWGGRFFSGMHSKNRKQTVDSASADRFERWCEARTGQALVDACMRELAQTGWLSNRGRQIVANYLAKVLYVDWRLGADYFERQLIDYDAASNWGNWAYQAGVGQDPRNRLFDPERQAVLYDPVGEYRRRWQL